MPLTTEIISIPKGKEWTLITIGSDYSFDVQNLSGVVIEYTYNVPIAKGLQLFTGERLLDNTQDLYIRNETELTQADIGVVRDSNA